MMGSNVVQLSQYAFLCLIYLASCSRYPKNQKPDNENPVFEIAANTTNTNGVFFNTQPYRNYEFNITLSRFPSQIKDLNCQVHNFGPDNCMNRQTVTLPMGEHVLHATYILNDVYHSQESHFFINDKYEVLQTTKDIVQPLFALRLRENSHFTNLGPVHIGKDLELDFYKPQQSNCTPKLMCNRGSKSWKKCKTAKKPSLNVIIDKEAILRGLQYLRVKLVCDEDQEESQPLTLSFYGVPDGYEPRSLRSIRLGNYRKFQLERPQDCLGGRLEVLERENWIKTTNLWKEKEATGRKFRMTCKSSGGEISGPSYLL